MCFYEFTAFLQLQPEIIPIGIVLMVVYRTFDNFMTYSRRQNVKMYLYKRALSNMIHECTGSFNNVNNSPPDLFVNNAFMFIQGVKNMHSVYLFVYMCQDDEYCVHF